MAQTFLPHAEDATIGLLYYFLSGQITDISRLFLIHLPIYPLKEASWKLSSKKSCRTVRSFPEIS